VIFAFSVVDFIVERRARRARADSPATEMLNCACNHARRRFGIPFWQPVRVAYGGSHGNLCHPMLTLSLQRDLADSVHEWEADRVFAARFFEALRSMKGVEVQWLADGLKSIEQADFPRVADPFPYIPAGPRGDTYRKLAVLARNALRGHPRFRQILGTVPLIYYETGSGWNLFGDGEAPTITRSLLRNFAASPFRRCRSVLVKLVPEDDDRRNPCDNPIVNAAQLAMASAAGIEAILLDSRYGVTDDLSASNGSSSQLPVYAA
jgi:hypothetical protein